MLNFSLKNYQIYTNSDQYSEKIYCSGVPKQAAAAAAAAAAAEAEVEAAAETVQAAEAVQAAAAVQGQKLRLIYKNS